MAPNRGFGEVQRVRNLRRGHSPAHGLEDLPFPAREFRAPPLAGLPPGRSEFLHHARDHCARHSSLARENSSKRRSETVGVHVLEKVAARSRPERAATFSRTWT